MSARIYISGSALGWEYATGSITTKYSAPGALPTPTLSEFASVPVGKVWVTTNDNFLYYKDEVGTTRFLQGRLRGPASAAEGTGSVFVSKHVCPDYSSSVLFGGANVTPGQDLTWTARGNKYLYRAQQAPEPSIKSLRPRINFDITAGTLDGGNATRNYRFELSVGDGAEEVTGVKVNVDAGPAGTPFFKLYTNSTCTSELGGIYLNEFGGNETLSLPKTSGFKWLTTSSLFTINLTGDPALYIRAETGSANVNVGNSGRQLSANRQHAQTFCAGIDQMVLEVLSGGQCISLGSVGTPSPPPPPPTPPPACGSDCSSIQYSANHPDCTNPTCPNCDGFNGCVSY